MTIQPFKYRTKLIRQWTKYLPNVSTNMKCIMACTITPIYCRNYYFDGRGCYLYAYRSKPFQHHKRYKDVNLAILCCKFIYSLMLIIK